MPMVGSFETDGGVATQADFDGRVDVVPVSDPNIFSSAQRIAMAQSALQLAQAMPDLADRREAAVQLLNALRFPNAEKIFPKKQTGERADPVTEGSLVLLGRPLDAYLDQNHPAHIQVHMAQMQGLPPPFQPAMQAHIAEHMAMQQRLQFQQMMGVPLPPLNFQAESTEPMVPQLPPEVENQIAMMAAQAVQQMQQQQMAQQQAQQQAQQGGPAQPPQPQGEDPRVAQAQFQMDQQRKDAAFKMDQQRKDQAAMADVDRKDAMAGLSPQLVKDATQFVTETGVQMSPRELALLSKVLGLPFQKVVSELARILSGGQGGSQFQQTENFVNRRNEFR
jgi:hypothetical protein